MIEDSQDPFKSVVRHLEGIPSQINSFERFIQRMFRSITYGTLLTTYFVYVLYVTLVFSAPFLITSSRPIWLGIGAITYNVGAVMCHQLPHRSLFLNGIQLPVCARDFGFVIGLVIGVAYASWSKKIWKPLTTLKVALIFCIPLAVDGLAQTVFVLRESTNAMRFISGALVGLGLGVYVLNKALAKRVELREYTKKPENILVSLFAAVLIYGIISNTTASWIGERYVSTQGAREIVYNETGSRNLEIYYIPPKTPVSLGFDPYLERHKDNIASDLTTEFKRYCRQDLGCQISYNVSTYMPNKGGQLGPEATLDLIPKIMRDAIKVPLERGGYGMWVVIAKEVEDAGSPHTNAKGQYYYIDAWTGEVLSRTWH
jgi:uncharacterized membrane protein